MNASQVLNHFDRISEAPDAIPRLRRFILDLAVRGKLVPPDPHDEPVSELLKNIAAKNKVRPKKKTPADANLVPEVKPEEILFEIPEHWHWARLGIITQVIMGQSPPGDTYNKTGEGIPLINGPVEFTDGPFGLTCINQYTTAPTNICEKGDLLLCVRGSTTGRTNIAGFRACIGRGVAAISSFFEDDYVRLFIWRSRESIIDMGRGIAFPSISRRQIEDMPVPLPPFGEQRRIVSKVNDLLALCDQLAESQKERETRRDRLRAASLHGLNNGNDDASIRKSASFFIQHLPRLTTRKEHIDQLRKTILCLAVRGKLVPQDPNDEPASQLLKQISAEKARLVQIGKIPKGKCLPDINIADLPFSLPNNWRWVRLGFLSEIVTSGSRDWAQFYSNEGAIFLRMGNLSRDSYHLRLDAIQHVIPPVDAEGSRTKLAAGDILISITGEVGLLGLIPDNLGDAYINQHTCLFRPISLLKNRYLPEVLRSPLCTKQFNTPQRGIKNSFRLTDITDLLVPLPPIKEQERIVRKIDEVMALCDQLTTGTKFMQHTNARLLNAMVREAL